MGTSRWQRSLVTIARIRRSSLDRSKSHGRHEQSGHRPVIVLTPRQYNAPSGLCIICPITSRARGYPFEVAIPHGHAISGIILVDQVRSVSWEKRYVKMASVAPAKLLDEVRERLAALLQLD